MPKRKQGAIGRFFSEMGDAIAESNERARVANERRVEERKQRAAIEAMHRSTVEDAIREYERATDRTFIPKGMVPESEVHNSEIKILPYEAWDYDHKGHLISCSSNCSSRHCLTCGDAIFGVGVYCSTHRP